VSIGILQAQLDHQRHCEEPSDEAIHSSLARQDGLLSLSLSSGGRAPDPLARNDASAQYHRDFVEFNDVEGNGFPRAG
jgi:hypothetical protein